MSGVKNWGSILRQGSPFVILALAGTLVVALAITGWMFATESKNAKGARGVDEKAAIVSLIERTFPNYQTHSETIINGIALQTIYGQSDILGYSATLFNTGCTSCRKELLFVAASAEDRKITAVEVIAQGHAQDEHVRRFLRQFIGKGLEDDLALGRGIQIEDGANLTGAIAITDAISEFLRAIEETGDR
jgi:hypothetical protein